MLSVADEVIGVEGFMVQHGQQRAGELNLALKHGVLAKGSLVRSRVLPEVDLANLLAVDSLDGALALEEHQVFVGEARELKLIPGIGFELCRRAHVPNVIHARYENMPVPLATLA